MAVPGFRPGLSEEQWRAMIEEAKVREGYLHCWTQEVDTCADVPVAKSMALIEDIEDGRIYLVDYQLLAFKEGVL